MKLSERAQSIHKQISSSQTKLGDLRTIAKEIKKDHQLANELWSTFELMPRLLAILIMDVKQLDQKAVDLLMTDIQLHQTDERLQLADWLMANQLSKHKNTITLMQSWQNHHSALYRRIFWYYQARLRWTGQKPPENTSELLKAIEQNLLSEKPEVQWAMNFTAGWIGVFDHTSRQQCIDIGTKTGLYKDEVVARNCTPNYLPAFIDIEAAKRNL